MLLGARVDGRVQLVLNIDKGLVERGLDAAEVIREIAGLVSGGGGGGRTSPRPAVASQRSSATRSTRARRLLVAALS